MFGENYLIKYAIIDCVSAKPTQNHIESVVYSVMVLKFGGLIWWQLRYILCHLSMNVF